MRNSEECQSITATWMLYLHTLEKWLILVYSKLRQMVLTFERMPLALNGLFRTKGAAKSARVILMSRGFRMDPKSSHSS